MSKSAVIDPADIPGIAVPSMDATHHEEVALVNEIGKLILAGQAGELDREALLRKLNEWVEHTRVHFARENQLMEENHFPAYVIHSQEHRQALAGLEATCQDWRERGDLQALADYVFTLWPEWFRTHVNSMDAMTAIYLSQQGIQ